jgi:carboxymethylenebutenolidase
LSDNWLVVSSNLNSPLKQFKSGIPIEEIKCKENLITILKKNGNPACVKPLTAEKLIERRWATFDISG